MRSVKFTARHKKIFAVISVAAFVIFSAAVIWFAGRPMIRFASDPDKFRDWINSHGIWGQLAYMGMVFFQVIFALIPGEPLEIGGGYAFGALEGTVLCLIGAAAGSAAVFWFVRICGIRLVEVFFSKEKIQSLKFLRMSSRRRNYIFLIIFMIPGTPKDLLCYFAGLTDIKFPIWFLISSLGRIPSVVTSTIGGDALGTQNYWQAAAVFLITLIISITGMIIYQKISDKHNQTKLQASRDAKAQPDDNMNQSENRL